MIAVKNVSKSFGNKKVLQDISLKVEPGEFVCIFGPSGSGKTVMLSLMLGEEHPTTGSIEVDGANLARVPAGALQIYRRRSGVLFQDGKLLPHATVRENISLPLEIWGAPEAWLQNRVEELLIMLGIDEVQNAFPSELSTGEKVKVGLARAIAAKPLILFADEPTGNLDIDEAAGVIRVLQKLNKNGTTVVFFTHDAALLELLDARIITLNQGKVATTGETAAKTHPVKAKHDVFAERSFDREPQADLQHIEPVEAEHAEEQKEEPKEHKKTKKKVHITSINS